CPVREAGEAADAFAQRLRFAMKFQQYTSPVQAKGMEDTVFYRYSPLASLNEVGSAAGRRATTPQEFHDANMYRMERWPDAMLTTSTHDTKRGEDARMRIHVLTEISEEWKSKLLEWAAVNEGAKTEVNGNPSPERADEYLYYQNLLGMWPPRQTAVTDELVSRMKAFMNKALKEAKIHTSWINPSNEYDAAVEKFVEQTLRGPSAAGFLASFIPFAERVAVIASRGSVSQIAVKLMSPGVVDTYQGGELWDLSLVDPDNRRPVDYATRQERLHRLTSCVSSGDDGKRRTGMIADLCREWWTGDLKLLYTTEGLNLRAREPELLGRGKYLALRAEGPAAGHVVAFAREYQGKWLLTIALRWFASLLSSPDSLCDLREKLQGTYVEVPTAAKNLNFTNILTGAPVAVETGGKTLRMDAGAATGGLPTGWLITDQNA
ncbi:MAG: hypothetical protein ABI164_11915, partial [Acidobacteriaceae bacterium]